MRKKIQPVCLLCIFLMSLCIGSCKKDLEDPCKNADKAPVELGTLFSVEDSLFEEDTFLLPTTSQIDITFKVLGSGTSYDSVNWHIGSDPTVYTEKEFNLTFDKWDIGAIDIDLFVWLKPNSCFSEDTTLIKLHKTIYILDQENTPFAFEGTFRGSNSENTVEVFDVTIVNFGLLTPPYNETQYWLHIHNLTQGCGGEEVDRSILIPPIQSASYHHFYINSIAITPSNCQEIEGYGKIEQDTITIDYTYRVKDTNEFKTDRFVGIKR